MKNVYIGDAVLSSDIWRVYEELFEDMYGIIALNGNEGDLEILIYEDYRVPNNPFSEITRFPLNISFSFDKRIMEEDFVYNIWQINIPFNLIERITEEYEDDYPGHDYKLILNNGDQIHIIGGICRYTEDGSSCLFDSEIDDLIHTQFDIYNKVHITCKITEKDISTNYLNHKLENEKYFLGRITNPTRKVDSLKKISEIRDRLRNLDNDDLRLDLD